MREAKYEPPPPTRNDRPRAAVLARRRRPPRMKAEPRHAGGNGPEPASHLRHGIGYAGAKTARSARRRERASACGAIRLRRGTTAASPRCGRAGNRAGLRWRPARYAEILAYYAAHGEAWDKLAIYVRQAGRRPESFEHPPLD
jgi:hypothetical protein